MTDIPDKIWAKTYQNKKHLSAVRPDSPLTKGRHLYHSDQSVQKLVEAGNRARDLLNKIAESFPMKNYQGLVQIIEDFNQKIMEPALQEFKGEE